VQSSFKTPFILVIDCLATKPSDNIHNNSSTMNYSVRGLRISIIGAGKHLSQSAYKETLITCKVVCSRCKKGEKKGSPKRCREKIYLRGLEGLNTERSCGLRASKQTLGMGGLASALALAKEGFTSIDVYEYASDLGFVGAGIQLAPNMARILDRLGVWEEIKSEAVEAQATSIRSLCSFDHKAKFIDILIPKTEGSTDDELANVNLSYVEPTYAYPHIIGHRSSLATGLFNGDLKEPTIKFHFSYSAVVNSFGDRPSVKISPRDGSPEYTVESDIILAADGTKSKTRIELLRILGVKASVQDTNQAAYRIMINREQILDDPELLELMDGNRITRWISEKRHIIAYPISINTIYNMSTTQPDTNFSGATNATYTTRGKLIIFSSDIAPPA
jgi:salicylate hydroxylase